MIVADARCNLVHALLAIELELRHALNKAEGQAARTHLVNRRLECLRRAEGLRPREHNV